ncbi:MAG: hypothetical protein HQL66_05435 [Magnetococcales bacterium]|nr:hypothetical protein [Magnetococcales bacterium]
MKKSLRVLTLATLIAGTALATANRADAWWGGPFGGGNGNFSLSMGGWGNGWGDGYGWGGGPYGGGWGGGPWGW